MQRVRKEFLIKRVTERVRTSPLIAITQVGNLTHSEKEEVRNKLHSVGGDITYVKNTLVAQALGRIGGEAEGLVPLLRGDTAFVSGPNSMAKMLLELPESVPKFGILGALYEQQRVLEHPDVNRLAKLPSAEVVHGRLVAQMLPGTALQIPNVGAHLVSVLHMHVNNLESQGAGDADAPTSDS